MQKQWQIVKKLIEKSRSATITNRSQSPTPRGRKKGQKLARTKQTTNAREAHRPDKRHLPQAR